MKKTTKKATKKATKKVAKKKKATKKTGRRRLSPQKKALAAKKRRMTILKKKSIEIDNREELYTVINQVQMSRQVERIIIYNMDLVATFENILKDAGIEYTREGFDGAVAYEIEAEERPEIEELDLDMLEDDIVEEGQLFG